MRLFKTFLYRVCQLLCLCSAAYMTYMQFQHYLKNEDFASISYRKFNNEEKDEYPSFTVCLVGLRGQIFTQFYDVFNTVNYTTESYSKYLNGFLEDYPAEFGAMKFGDVVLDIKGSYLLWANGNFLEGSLLDYMPLVMIPTFPNPNTACVSKHISYRKDVRQIFDVFALNSLMLYYNGISVEIFVHHQGQFMRTLRSKIIAFDPDETIARGIHKVIDIGQVDILRKRETSKIPCDSHIKNEDEYAIHKVILDAGCIPTFWERFAESIGFNQTIGMCKSASDYIKITEHRFAAMESFAMNDGIYKQSCTEMMPSITTRDETSEVAYGQLRVEIQYHQDKYREIKNTRAYTSETLLGQVGGFVGM